mmetsp:Transcript_59794/g.129531  ORF Transcript_59794/g.129531 Transcript_59794/m.129531 type:complete len:206 (-) Transcript_59794:634-1251(-)
MGSPAPRRSYKRTLLRHPPRAQPHFGCQGVARGGQAKAGIPRHLLEGLVQGILVLVGILDSLLAIGLPVQPLEVRAAQHLPCLHPQSSGRHVERVQIQGLTGEAPGEDADRVQNKPRPDLSQSLLLGIIDCSRDLRSDLVVAEPNLLVHIVKAADVVVEGLALRMVPRCAKGLHKHILDQLQERYLAKVFIEVQNGSRAEEAIAR